MTAFLLWLGGICFGVGFTKGADGGGAFALIGVALHFAAFINSMNSNEPDPVEEGKDA